LKYLVLCLFLIFIGLGIHGAIADTMPVDLSISLDDDMLIADGEDQATINVYVFNRTTGQAVPDLPVNFTLNDEMLGFISVSETTTDSGGHAETVFTADYATGKAIISVMVDYFGTDLGPWEGTIYVIGYPDTVNISGSVDWLIAGQTTTSSLITVEALNQSRPIPMLDVEFSLLDPTMGSINLHNSKTGVDGKANTRCYPSTRSGVAPVQATVIFRDGTIVYREPIIHYQLVDHATPKEINWLDYPVEMLVGDNTTIQVHYVDQYNNSVDNRRYPEYLNFSVYSPSTDNPNPPEAVPAGFWNGDEYVEMITIELDENGFATVDMRADTRPGNNGITIDPQFTGDNRYINIEGIGEAVPVAIEYDISSYSPPDPYPNIPADGESVFTILYTLRDQFNNPVENRYFWMNTTLGESTKLKTNSSGMVKITYGPKIRTDIIDILMTACDAKPDGTYATNSATVEVTSTEPVQMVLTANPQFIPSWDVPGENTASIKAVVMDRYGNPVKDETVVMQIIPGTWDYEYDSGLGPQWRDYGDSTIVLTTVPHESPVDSYALAELRPGFFPGLGDPPEHDSCLVTAQWDGYPTQSVIVNWTNVPFLSIITNVEPAVVSWNETLNINIKVVGNGYALHPKAIDVSLCTDRSGSMLYDNQDRMHSIREAAKQFVASMTPRDQVGLVTFGYKGKIYTPGDHSFSNPWYYIDNVYVTPKTYSGYATVDKSLTDDLGAVSTELDLIVPDSGTPMRGGLYEAIKDVSEKGRSDSVKAVILLSDGDYNWYGDPLARGSEGGNWRYYYGWYWDPWSPTEFDNLDSHHYVFDDLSEEQQNLSRFAVDNDIKIYSIAFGTGLSDDGKETLELLATTSGGKYYEASATDIEDVYTDIAGELKEEAGVGVTMDLPFNDVSVSTNTSSWTMNGEEIFDYIPYTDEWKYWFNATPVTTIYRDQYRDDTLNWEAGALDFDIGTIRLNQTWETTFNLKVLNNSYNVGRITLFDQDATIMFSDGTDWHTLSLPTTYITCIGDQSETQIATEEAGYDNIVTTIDDTIVTVSFDRVFLVDGIRYTNPWPYRWYEEYFISIPGYMGKTRIGKETIDPADQIPFGVPLQGTFTFDLKPFLPSGRDDVDFIFYVEGEDERGLGGRFRFGDSILGSRDGIFIFLK